VSIDCKDCGNFTVGSGRPVITSAVRHDDGSPGVKVKWTTTIPPECILNVTVWSQYGDHHTSTNVTQTDEATLSDLRCDTQYDLALRVYHLPTRSAVFSNTVSVYVGVPPTPVNLIAAATANNAGIVASWGWNHGLFQCLYQVQLVYQPEGSDERVIDLGKQLATITTLQNLQPNRQYTIYVNTVGTNGTRAQTQNVTLLVGRGI